MESTTILIKSDINIASKESIVKGVKALIEKGIVQITFDCTKVDVVDSCGIGFLVQIQNSLKKNNGQLILIHVNDEIKKLFQFMRIDQHIQINS